MKQLNNCSDAKLPSTKWHRMKCAKRPPVLSSHTCRCLWKLWSPCYWLLRKLVPDLLWCSSKLADTIPLQLSSYHNFTTKQLFNCWSAFCMCLVLVLKISVIKMPARTTENRNKMCKLETHERKLLKSRQVNDDHWKHSTQIPSCYGNDDKTLPRLFSGTPCSVM